MVDQRFRAFLRLRHNREFQRVFERKRSVSNSWMILYGCENDLPYSRVGLTVSRRYGNAVARHRWKRWVREAFRQQRVELPPGIDIVVLPRIGESSDYAQLSGGFTELVNRLSRRLHKQ
ncbi:MAG: ribonuclease P protein component [Planctomycetota bacterium]|nr:ribonuclease P protein component [Planctomycetota bacterium]